MFFSQTFASVLGLLSIAGTSSAFTNPIRNPGGSDPQTVYSDGWYYFISTNFNDLSVARSKTIAGLKTAESKVVYRDTNPTRCCNVWAPELHFLGDKWYIYYTAGENGSDNLGGQRSHVVQGGATPWDEFRYGAQLTNDWGIDGTILRFNDFGNYFVYSCMTGVPNQSTCIRKLGADNMSLEGPLSILSQPTEAWERSETPVQEGQAGLYFGGKTYIAYSANYCWTADYCVALLEWNGKDPMAPTSWTKSRGCSLTSGNGNFGTGHNSFFMSPDGNQTWITFHATANPNGACDNNRYAMIQPLTANADGTPNFGRPEGNNFQWDEPSGTNA
jgi:GH43 family beta-xylosidase